MTRIVFRHPIKFPKNGRRIAANIPPTGNAVLRIPKAVLLHFLGNHSIIPLLAAGRFILTAMPVKPATTSNTIKLGAMECSIIKIPINRTPKPKPHFGPLRSTKWPVKIETSAEVKKKRVECKPNCALVKIKSLCKKGKRAEKPSR